MTEFMNKSFSVGMAGDQQYRDNWERTFGKKKDEPPKEPVLICERCPNPGRACNDPYAEDVNNEIVPTVLCEECYRERCDDI